MRRPGEKNPLRRIPPVVVDHHRLRDVEHLPAAMVHAGTPVDVLEIEKEPLVHRSHVVDRAPPREETGADHPIDVLELGVVPVEHQVLAERPMAGKEATEERAAEKHRRGR